MICSNILSQDSHLIVNMVVAHNFGLNTAVYWASLSEILPRVRRKNTIDENGFFSMIPLSTAKSSDCRIMTVIL